MDDLKPYGFVPRMVNSCRAFNDMMVRRRQAHSLYEVIRRLVLDRDRCTRQLVGTQLDIDVANEAAIGHKEGERWILYYASREEMSRLQRHSRRIMTLRSLADQVIRMLTEEKIGTDILMTLERYTQVPFIRFSRSRLDKVIQNVQKRTTLTSQQTTEFKSLLEDLDEGEREREDMEGSTSISPARESLDEDLAKLRELKVPETL